MVAYPRRIEFPGACYHVINRGNFRRWLLRDHGAACAFERTLAQAATRFGWEIHAYVIMGTHFHLAVRLGEPNLSAGMQWLQSTWVRRYNAFRKIVGRPFQGRYKSILAEPGVHFAQVCHYIHLNPVRAKIVAANQASDYPYGSLPRMARSDRFAWLNPHTALSAVGGLSDDAEGWKRYALFLEFAATDQASQRELARDKLSRGWCVGSQEFKAEIRQQWQDQGLSPSAERFCGLEPDRVRVERENLWSETLQRMALAAGVSLNNLSAKKSAPGKVLLAAAMKDSTSVTNAWLCDQLAMGRTASVSQFVRRFLQTPAGKAATAALLSKVKA